MKRLYFRRPNRLSPLHDELLAAIPALSPVPNARGELQAVMHVEGLGDDIWLTVPDDADEAAINAVVQAHNPLAPRPPTAAEITQAQAISDKADALVEKLSKPFKVRSVELTREEKGEIKAAAVDLIKAARGR